MSIDFAKIAASATVASDSNFPATTATQRKAADPALVQLVTEAPGDGKRRELNDRFSTKPFPGRKGVNEFGQVANELHRAARQMGCKVQIRRFDADKDTARLTFKAVK